MSELPTTGTTRFESAEFWGELGPEIDVRDPAGEAGRVSDPASAVETVHWGRNYLYSVELSTSEGSVPAIVKQFRNQSLRQRLERRFKGSKAERSWRPAIAMWKAGIPTPQPLMLIESRPVDKPSFFVTRQLPDVTEARFLFRALKAGSVDKEFPGLDLGSFVDALGETVRRMHDAGFWHRDLSIGNVLLGGVGQGGAPSLSIIDLNRARQKRAVSVSQRTRDLCRLGFPDRRMSDRMLSAYWSDRDRALGVKRWLYGVYRTAYLTRVEGKKAVRDWLRSLGGMLFGRKPHVHIPDAPENSGARDKSVWDKLSDQPHQHATRGERLRVRLADIGTHSRALAVTLGAMPRAKRRYRELVRGLWKTPVAWPGAGVAVGPESGSVAELLDALSESGAAHVLMRLHPWEDDWDDSERLAGELAARGVDLTFALPQVRPLVRDAARWETAVSEIGERFVRYGRRFQVGQAINRSKWGVWNYREYVELVSVAARALQGAGEVELLGPAVIDFEPHAMVAALNYPGATAFDIVSGLLYVDRRGAPENRQLGYDTLGKVALMRAIGETAGQGTSRYWVTEVNWPLWEGPHSPAGKTVSVDEESQADYMVRYYLPVLASGLAERIYWWQLVAPGYGLIDPRGDSPRRRPSFHALRTLAAQLEGTLAHGPQPSPPNTRLHRFTHPDRGDLLVGWSLEGQVRVDLPRPAQRVVSRDGEESGSAAYLTASPSPQYAWLKPA